jgi:DNA-binding NarL/FixJ family response regulator
VVSGNGEARLGSSETRRKKGIELAQLANGNAGNGATVNGAAKADRQSEPRRTILFIANAGMISDSLISAIEREFPWAVVEQVERIDQACVAFVHPVSLILVDSRLLGAAEAASRDLSRLHPLAFAAVLELDGSRPICSFAEVFGSRLVRGVLPMDLKLDVWLSVVRLMLRGGDYFPPGMFQSYASEARLAPPGLGRVPTATKTNEDLADLTDRENQILAMVSRGLQNKAIAAELRLSEHTVKIHLHNIISKLGAHNRTEAAARFRDHQNGRPLDLS